MERCYISSSFTNENFQTDVEASLSAGWSHLLVEIQYFAGASDSLDRTPRLARPSQQLVKPSFLLINHDSPLAAAAAAVDASELCGKLFKLVTLAIRYCIDIQLVFLDRIYWMIYKAVNIFISSIYS